MLSRTAEQLPVIRRASALGAYRSLRFGPAATGSSVAMAAQKDQKWRSFRAWKTDLREMNFMPHQYSPQCAAALSAAAETALGKGRVLA